MMIYFIFSFSFDMDDPETKKIKRINVVSYFKVTRNYVIKYPHLPCLHVGNIAKKTAIPIEVNAIYIMFYILLYLLVILI
jgi:hypothetical protein